MPLTPPISSFINGKDVRSSAHQIIEGINPFNGAAIHQVPLGSAADVDYAVAAARAAFDSGSWNDQPPSRRKAILTRWADLIAEHAPELDALDAEEMGKPVSVAFCNAAGAAEFCRFYAEALDKFLGEFIPSDTKSLVINRRIPRGVVAAITPWNFPTFNAVMKVAPALAAGNAVVLKPSEQSVRSSLAIARLAIEAGVPAGIFNVILGVGDPVGRALGLHTDVDMIGFTGSTAVGKLMLQFSGQSNMKHVLAECGGKSPHIVFDDGVDLDACASAIANMLITNQGQICSVGSRLLVQQSIELPLIERIAAKLDDVTIGDPLAPSTTFGPLASARQFERVMSFIAAAPTEGATLVTGGTILKIGSGGYFVAPTIYRNVPATAAIARQEIFGPVLSVTAFDSESDAVGLANSSDYGLAAYVWSARTSTGMRMTKALRASVFLNAAAPSGEAAGYAASHEPFGHSGFGTEGGLAGLESYMKRQLLLISHD